MKNLFQLLFFLSFVTLPSWAMDSVHFDALESRAQLIENKDFKTLDPSILEESEIIIRGFLAQSPDGDWLLVDKPNIRSCCLGKTENLKRQLTLKGSFSENDLNRALTLSGTLAIELKKNDRNEIQQFYTLNHAQPYPKHQKRLPLAFLMTLGGTALCGTLYVRRKKISAKR